MVGDEEATDKEGEPAREAGEDTKLRRAMLAAFFLRIRSRCICSMRAAQGWGNMGRIRGFIPVRSQAVLTFVRGLMTWLRSSSAVPRDIVEVLATLLERPGLLFGVVGKTG